MLSLLRIVVACLFWASLATHAAGDVKLWSGGETPALELKDVTGASRRLEDYRGKVVLLNFWATWCVACHVVRIVSECLRREAVSGKQ